MGMPVLSSAAEVLSSAAQHARDDRRAPRRATQTLWSRLHGLSYGQPDGVAVLGAVFRALATEAGFTYYSDISRSLGSHLQRLSADERADLCVRAARRVGADECVMS